jgi:hypothetical protein
MKWLQIITKILLKIYNLYIKYGRYIQQIFKIKFVQLIFNNVKFLQSIYAIISFIEFILKIILNLYKYTKSLIIRSRRLHRKEVK